MSHTPWTDACIHTFDFHCILVISVWTSAQCTNFNSIMSYCCVVPMLQNIIHKQFTLFFCTVPGWFQCPRNPVHMIISLHWDYLHIVNKLRALGKSIRPWWLHDDALDLEASGFIINLTHFIDFFLLIIFYLFSMASMFLRSSRSCQVLSSSLSENRRWCPVTHSAPLRGPREATLSTTSSTLAVLICSENSISVHHKYRPSRRKALAFTNVPLTPFATARLPLFEALMNESVPFEQLLNEWIARIESQPQTILTLQKSFQIWIWILFDINDMYISPL